MTDGELLELAAKAMGYTFNWGNTQELSNGKVIDISHVFYVNNGVEWNPLTDDGDALRLAVKLRMTVDVNHFFNKVEVRVYSGKSMFMPVEESEDIYAATRRAIVRAAAEIGKEMT